MYNNYVFQYIQFFAFIQHDVEHFGAKLLLFIIYNSVIAYYNSLFRKSIARHWYLESQLTRVDVKVVKEYR